MSDDTSYLILLQITYMKKLLLFILTILGYTTIKAQGNYTFSHSTMAYTELSGGTQLFPVGFFDTLALGFDFMLDGRTNDTLKLRPKGTISADTVYTLAERTFEPFGGEHGQGSYSYLIEGQPGNRIVKLQYKNVKFDHDMTGADRINFQVWLFETDNAVEVHYGPSTILNPDWDYYYQETGPYVGLIDFKLKGPVANPVTDTAIGTRLTGTPPNGTVYRFLPSGTSVKQLEYSEFKINVYPNPANDVLYLPQSAEATILDITGKKIAQTKTSNQNAIDISSLTPGIYILRTKTGYASFNKL
jgi:hypothetical protein